MTAIEKKAMVNTIILNGDKRSYNEIMADLELMLWKDKIKGK